MVEFLRHCNLTLGLLAVNSVRIICGIEKLNEIQWTSLGLTEQQCCYSFNWQTYGYYLKVKNDAPNLVLALRDSQRECDEDEIILIGDIVPNPLYKPVPWCGHGPSLCL